MSQLGWTAIVWLTWLAAFLVLELPAVFGKTPWMPLSNFVWWIEGDWHPMTIAVLLFFAWLLVHLVAHWTPAFK